MRHGPKHPFGVVLVGTGLAAAMHARALQRVPSANLVGVLGSSPVRGEAFARCHGLARAYGDLDALCRDARIEVVHLCTPPHTHLALTTALVAVGKHVLVDKPLARTVAEADRMIEAAERAGVQLGGLFQHRFIPMVRRVHDAVAAGEIGRLFLVDCSVKWWRDDAYFSGSSWRARKETEGGGAMINQAIHSIDLLQWIAGPVTEVTAHVETVLHPIATEDLGVAMLRLGEQGRCWGVVQGSTAVYPGMPERLELHGTLGTIILDEGRRRAEYLVRGKPPRVDRGGPAQGNASDPAAVSPRAHALAFSDFLRAVDLGRRPEVDGHEARKALQVVEAIYRSSRSGGRRATLLRRTERPIIP